MLLEGQVLDAHTGRPVPEAEVHCIGPGEIFHKFSDGKGYFRFLLLNSGRWQVEVNKPPYSGIDCRMILGGNSFVSLSLELDALTEEAVTA